jgi:uncharacterized protein
MLTPSDSSVLLLIARDAIEHRINETSYNSVPREEKKLNDCAGCFVTITQHGKLRGCIGNFQSQQPLYREVAQMAVASATEDPRFPPLQKADLENINLEITVLSPLQKIENIDEIIVGTHGIYIEKGLHRGVLLPQVATEHSWDSKIFLQQTSLKAGLNAEDWQLPDAEIYIFSGQIVNDHN